MVPQSAQKREGSIVFQGMMDAKKVSAQADAGKAQPRSRGTGKGYSGSPGAPAGGKRTVPNQERLAL